MVLIALVVSASMRLRSGDSAAPMYEKALSGSAAWATMLPTSRARQIS